jgi:hypothetical protein
VKAGRESANKKNRTTRRRNIQQKEKKKHSIRERREAKMDGNCSETLIGTGTSKLYPPFFSALVIVQVVLRAR